MSLNYHVYKSPVGDLYLVASDSDLVALVFSQNWPKYAENLGAMTFDLTPVLRTACLQLDEYFMGKRKVFDLPFNPQGTEFQKRVWLSLNKIPYGKTTTYGQQAQSVKNPKAVRAVGRANGQNPLSIVLPCHRVIGASGKLTGYGGGLDKKEFLLNLESAHLAI